MNQADDDKTRNTPLSESNVSLRLADIQRRCAELLNDADSELELALEEPAEEPSASDYFERD